MVLVPLTKREDQFRRSYWIDEEGQTGGRSILAGHSETIEYDTRGLLVFRTKVKVLGANAATYGIWQSKRDFTDITDLKSGDWEQVVAAGTSLAGGASSADYSKILSDGIRAVRIQLRPTADTTFEILTYGEP